MSVLKTLKQNALKSKKHIVLPEGSDKRIVEAAIILTNENYAKITLLGDVAEVNQLLSEHGYTGSDINVIDPKNADNLEQYANAYYEKRKAKGMTIEQASEAMLENAFYSAMMVELGDADGCVAGAVYSSGSVLSAGLRVIGTQKGAKVVSSVMILETGKKEFGDNGLFFCADIAVNPSPDAVTLADIAISTNDTWVKFIGNEPRVALLSFSTKGSAVTDSTKTVAEALTIVNEKRPDIMIDGEMQLDAAIVDTVGKRKAPESSVAGKANILIFPDLNSGNIGYKIIERFADNAIATGPILQGMNKPYNDLSRGCSTQDVVNTVLATVYQASHA